MSRGSKNFFSEFWALVDGLRSQWSVFQRAKAPEIGGFCALICFTDSNADDVCFFPCITCLLSVSIYMITLYLMIYVYINFCAYSVKKVRNSRSSVSVE